MKALKVPITVLEKVENTADADLDSLSSGLMIRKVPPIVKPGNAIVAEEEVPILKDAFAPKLTGPQVLSDSLRASPQALEPSVSSTMQVDEASEVRRMQHP